MKKKTCFNKSEKKMKYYFYKIIIEKKVKLLFLVLLFENNLKSIDKYMDKNKFC